MYPWKPFWQPWRQPPSVWLHRPCVQLALHDREQPGPYVPGRQAVGEGQVSRSEFKSARSGTELNMYEEKERECREKRGGV